MTCNATTLPPDSGNASATTYACGNSSLPANETFLPMEGAGVGRWLPVVLSHSATFVVGLVGNLLVIYSIAKCRRLQNVTNTFLASLATADLIIIVIVIPIQTPFYFSSKWVLGAALCKLLPYLTVLSSSCSVFMLTALSVERYIVIVHPLLAKVFITPGRARRVIIILWLVAVIYSFPPLYYKEHVRRSFANHPVFYTCSNAEDEVLGKAYSLYLLLGMYLVPLFVIIFCYTRIIYELWVTTRQFTEINDRERRARSGRQPSRTSPLLSRWRCSQPSGLDIVVAMDGVDEVDVTETGHWPKGQRADLKANGALISRQLQSRKQVIRMLIVAVSLFMVCWGPVLWLKFVIEFGYIERYSATRTYLSITFNLLSYLNSCMNPICYAFISRTFRESFYWAITSGCSDSPPSGAVTTHLATSRAASTLYRPASLQKIRNSVISATPDGSPTAPKRSSSGP